MDNISLELIEVFPWNPNFETGIPLIDEQHQRLVHLLNILAAHLAQESESIVIDQVFAELADYAHFHFQTEEEIWRRHFGDDDWFTGHKHAHTTFLERLRALKTQEKTKTLSEMVNEIVKFLTHWLAFHILDNDMRMAKAIRAIESGAGLDQAKEQSIIEMSSIMKVFTASVLAMYDTLAMRTLELVRERSERIRMESEITLLNEQLREKEKREIYVSMLKASHHILNNLLNQLHLFRMEAEASPDFDKVILGQFNEVFGQAENLVCKLSAVPKLDPESIINAVKPENTSE